MKINGGQYEERKKQNQAKENKKQAPMDCECCYRNSCGNFCSMCGRNVSNKGKCLEDTGRTFGGVHGLYSKTGVPSEDNSEETWHTPRLTAEEWEELYGGE